MTVIAWDGKSLCADRMAVTSGLKFFVTKIFKTEQGLIGIDGTMDTGLWMINWLKNGADPKDFPECQKDNDRYCHMLVITPDKEIFRYERQPFPIKIEEPFFAAGCGRDFALPPMHLGKTAREAALVASHFDNNCGDVIDELFL